MRDNKVDVTAATIQEWAEGTLEEWFQGYTGPDEKTNTQYRITLVDSDTYSVVDALRHQEPRVFAVTVSVTEIG